MMRSQRCCSLRHLPTTQQQKPNKPKKQQNNQHQPQLNPILTPIWIPGPFREKGTRGRKTPNICSSLFRSGSSASTHASAFLFIRMCSSTRRGGGPWNRQRTLFSGKLPQELVGYGIAYRETPQACRSAGVPKTPFGANPPEQRALGGIGYG